MAYMYTEFLPPPGLGHWPWPADEASPRCSSAWSRHKQKNKRKEIKAGQDERLLPSHPAIEEEEAGRCCEQGWLTAFVS
jgi:hypothetical protein